MAAVLFLILAILIMIVLVWIGSLIVIGIINIIRKGKEKKQNDKDTE